MIYISLICSFLYWINSYCISDYSNKIIVKSILKFLAVIFLINNDLTLKIFIFYSIGDVMLIHDEYYSLIFFMIGHLIKIHNFISIYLFLITIFFIPTIYIIQDIISTILNRKTLLHKLYISILIILFFIPLYSKYYGHIFFIISDIIIGTTKKYRFLSWPLYYINLLMLRYNV